MKKLFYFFILFSLRALNHIYFRRVKVYGKKNVPKDGGVIFSINHQAAFLDPLLVGTLCGRSVYSLTRGDVFGGFFQWFLDALQMIPIFRIRNGYTSLKNNTNSFEKCYKILSQKKGVQIFSEGTHHNEYYLNPISKGSSRLALESQIFSKETPIYLQPIGINYGHHQQAWHDIHFVFGKTIKVSDYIKQYEKNPAIAINKLKEELEIEMKACLWLPEKDASYFEKKKKINDRNTLFSFFDLKEKLNTQHQQLKELSEKTIVSQFFVFFFGIFNCVPLFISKRLTLLFKDIVFHSSIKYISLPLLFPIWWYVVYLGSKKTIDIVSPWWVVTLCVGLLYTRQWIRNNKA